MAHDDIVDVDAMLPKQLRVLQRWKERGAQAPEHAIPQEERVLFGTGVAPNAGVELLRLDEHVVQEADVRVGEGHRIWPVGVLVSSPLRTLDQREDDAVLLTHEGLADALETEEFRRADLIHRGHRRVGHDHILSQAMHRGADQEEQNTAEAQHRRAKLRLRRQSLFTWLRLANLPNSLIYRS
eukprot:scaffold383_cov272-Pinguiococcus_pyrenoidosus.AAC.1